MFEDSSNEADFSFQGKVNHGGVDREVYRGFERVFHFWVGFPFSKRVPPLDPKRIYHHKLRNTGLSSIFIFSCLIFNIKKE